MFCKYIHFNAARHDHFSNRVPMIIEYFHIYSVQGLENFLELKQVTRFVAKEPFVWFAPTARL